MELDFSAAPEGSELIGGFVYDYLAGGGVGGEEEYYPEFDGLHIRVSIENVKPGTWAKVTLSLRDSGKNERAWELDIPEQEPGESVWADFLIDVTSGPPTHSDPGFNLDKVSPRVHWTIEGNCGTLRYDHLVVEPTGEGEIAEPATLCLLGLGLVGLAARRRKPR